jgi:hypothetical protein
MSHTVLLQKLLVIEASIGKVPNGAVRDLVQEAQDYLLQLQKERAEIALRVQVVQRAPDPASTAA